jgi:hypothetical protein
MVAPALPKDNFASAECSGKIAELTDPQSVDCNQREYWLFSSVPAKADVGCGRVQCTSRSLHAVERLILPFHGIGTTPHPLLFNVSPPKMEMHRRQRNRLSGMAQLFAERFCRPPPCRQGYC